MDNEEHAIMKEFRFIRIVHLKHPHASHDSPPEDMSIPIHSTTTFKDIQTILDGVDRGQWTILATTFGPVPYWQVPTSESLQIEANCQTLYAVGSLEYVLAVVRASHSDYPIALDPSDLQDLSEAVVVAAPELRTITKTITGFSSIELIQDNIAGHIEKQRDKPYFPTVFVITTNDRPDQCEASLFDLEPAPEAPALQLLYLECTGLMRRSYDTRHYLFQILHVSEALIHSVVSLSRALKMVDSLSILLNNLEAYSRMMTEIMKEANNHNVNQEVATRIKRTVDEVFLHLCGDYPGAVAIRDSHLGFERLKQYDEYQEARRLAQISTSRPENRISKLMRRLPFARRDTDTLYLGAEAPIMKDPDESDRKRILYLQDIVISADAGTPYRVTLKIDKHNVEIRPKPPRSRWTPIHLPELMDSSKITPVLTSCHKSTRFGKREALVEISGKEATEIYWEFEDSISCVTSFDDEPATIDFYFHPSQTLETARHAVRNLQTAMEKYSIFTTSSTEQRVVTIIEYGEVVSEMIPFAKAAFGLARVTFDLLKDQRKYDEMVSDLASSVERILPFATHVLEDILYDETELLDGAVWKLYEVITDTAGFLVSYAKRSATSRAAESTMSISDRPKIKALQRTFGKLQEDFDRAVDVAALNVARRKEESRLLNRLKPTDVPNYEEDHSCLEGTCTAILADIASWVAKPIPHDTQSNGYDNSKMFWLYGTPGVGKTPVANTLCDHLRRSGNLAGGFYCRRYDPVLCEPKRVLPTLIYKLVEMWGPFRKQIARALHDDPQLNPESTRGELLLRALQSLKKYPSRTLVLVIDALDECGEPDTRAPLLQCLNAACSHAPWLKIIIISRPEHDITSFFNQHAVTSQDLVALPEV